MKYRIEMKYRIVESRTADGGYMEKIKPCFIVQRRIMWLFWREDRLFYQIEKAREHIKMMIEINSFKQRIVQ